MQIIEALELVLQLAEQATIPQEDDPATYAQQSEAIEAVTHMLEAVKSNDGETHRQLAEEALADVGLIPLMYMPLSEIRDRVSHGDKYTARQIKEAVDKATDEVSLPSEATDWYEAVAKKACNHLPEML